MANVGFNTPYTDNIILSQYLKIYFNQEFAASFAYQILIGLGTNFVGYGLAGVCRRFLVFPSYTVWPTSLVTIALNRAFHTEANVPVPGPLNRTYRWSRLKLFYIAFFGMFVYFWLPDFLFPALSYFNWISWIAPDNQVLNNICGSVNGLGLNPWPTFDWNIIAFQYDPLVIPAFATLNQLGGMIVGFFMIVGIYFTNAWNTSFLPINSNHVFDNQGKAYNVSRVVNSKGILDEEKYQAYSMPWMAAGNLTIYFWFFAVYSSTLTYAALFHRHEISVGFKQLFRKNRGGITDLTKDVHWRLMGAYKEVPEWWYMSVLAIAAALGMAGIGAWETYTSPAVVIFGIVLAFIFVIPVGIVTSITGIQVTLNVIAEFIGGGFVKGNALSMNFFKAFGYITTAQAVYFSNDLKLAHYCKLPPRTTFWAQLIATFISTLVCTGVFNFQLHLDGICTADAPWGFTCPGINTFFTAAVFWGTLGPHKLFGKGPYNLLLLGFPVGALLPVLGYFAKKRFPQSRLARQFHPVLFCVGGLLWSPYNFSYYLPAVPVAWLSWLYLKPRYLAFWAKYN
jgi:OPT family small oligopeptide transporter